MKILKNAFLIVLAIMLFQGIAIQLGNSIAKKNENKERYITVDKNGVAHLKEFHLNYDRLPEGLQQAAERHENVVNTVAKEIVNGVLEDKKIRYGN